jgi:very-short-patch-repair endonuclease
MSEKKYGPDLLFEQLVEHLAGDWDWLFEEAPGDSKIEKLLFRALQMRADICACEYTELFLAADAAIEARLMAAPPYGPTSVRMIVRPQAEVDNRRVDFLIHAFDYNNNGWRSLIVECDGHDYHERTKEQAARDRSKDRTATLNGRDFLRFTGSEIWRDPWGCAAQIGDWAAEGLG